MGNGKKLLVALAVPLMVTVGASAAQASTITFSSLGSSQGGTITVGGAVTIGDTDDGPNAGVDGRIQEVSVEGGLAAAITGVCDDFGCLELETGAFIGEDLSTDALDYLYNGAGSSIKIYGAVTDAGIDDETTLLYEGMYDENTNIRLVFDDNCDGPEVTAGACTGSLTGTVDGGTLNAALALYLGVPTALDDGNITNLFFGYRGIISGAPPSGTGTVNTNSLQTDTVIPEPGSMLLLGTGLLGFARAARRRMVRS